MTWTLGLIALLIVLLVVGLALCLQFSTSLDEHASRQRKRQFFHDEVRASPPDAQDATDGSHRQ